MTVSLKHMAESIEQIRLAMQRVEVGLHRHWMSPHWREQDGNFTIQGAGTSKTFSHNHTRTTIQILNPSSKPVTVTINVFDQGGSPTVDARKASLKPRSMQSFTLFDLLNSKGDGTSLGIGGWLDILAAGPIFPSGHVSEDASPSFFQLQTVGFSLHFYPVAEAQ